MPKPDLQGKIPELLGPGLKGCSQVLDKTAEVFADCDPTQMGAVREAVEELVLQSPNPGEQDVRQRLRGRTSQCNLQSARQDILIIGEGRSRGEGAFQHRLSGRRTDCWRTLLGRRDRGCTQHS